MFAWSSLSRISRALDRARVAGEAEQTGAQVFGDVVSPAEGEIGAERPSFGCHASANSCS
jgi:hypothetical protein